MPVSSRGPRRRRSWWCHTPLIDPGYPHACEAGGVQMRPCRHGLIWDHTVFHVVPHWRARPEIVAPLRSVTVGLPSGSPAHPNAPGVRTPSRCAPGMSPSGRWFRGISSVVCATGSLPGPRPKARRSPPPPHARALEQVTPQPGQPAQRSQDSLSSTGPHSRRATGR